MGQIRVLSDTLVNKIAAGEVVERPASVVKELLENALDAGASRIGVELTDGGRAGIVVEDDGAGMDADDLLLALERHATSKLGRDDDLFAIATLGFRGEALPSIGSVSRLSIASRPAGETEGAFVSVEGGRFLDNGPCGLFQGTRVEVKDLFFNVPARRKFLRAPATELTHVITLMEHYALARPDVAFTLSNNHRGVLNVPPSRDRTERFFELFPDLPREDFFDVHRESGAFTVRGLAGKPDRNFGRPRYQFTLVNGRFIRDRLIQHAVMQAYENTHPRGRYPVVLLALTVPFDKVDVNVHPTKREVRFTDGRSVHEGLAAAIRRAIAPGQEDREPLNPPGEGAMWMPSPGPAVREFPAPGVISQASSLRPFGHPTPSQATFQQALGAAGAGASPLKALGQWRSSFILCDSPEGLAIVDQHVAHERLRFEQFRRFIESPGPRQAFLTPHPYRLPREVAHREEEMAQILCEQGFEADPMGQGTVAVRSAPAFLTQSETDRLLKDFFESAGEVLKTPRDRWREVLVMRSCRGSVMLHDPLPIEKMQYLLDSLFALGAPLTCPHGRPIVFTLGESEILSRFDR